MGSTCARKPQWIYEIQCWCDAQVCEKMFGIMAIRERLREISKAKNLLRKGIGGGAGLLKWYVSRVEDGHAVPAIETLEKMARALEVPLYQLFHEGDEPPKLVQRAKSKTADESAWGDSEGDITFPTRFRKLLTRMNKDDQDLLFYVAQKMASPRQGAAPESSQAAQKRLIGLYHRLVDKQLEGTASTKELAQLQSIEGMMQAIEDSQTLRIDEDLEKQHRAIIERLTTLINELRRMAAASERPPMATQ
jgi:transcriptional regulator with XRE-family HTH domain